MTDPAIQVVNVLTPNHLHADAVLKAARAGKHILVEKPPAISLREMDNMAATCAAADVKIGVVLQCRTRRSVQAIRAAIQEGRFGKIYHADTFMKWFRSQDYYRMDAWRASRRSGAGVTIGQAFHYLDLLQYLVGSVKRVQAHMTNLAHPGIALEDTALAFVTYENGAQGVVEASTALWPGTNVRVEVNGDNGTAIVVGERMETWKFKDERPEDEEIRHLGSDAVATGARGPADLGFADHQAVIEDMVRAVAENREPMITLASARPTLEWTLAMYQSAKQGTPVELPIRDEECRGKLRELLQPFQDDQGAVVVSGKIQIQPVAHQKGAAQSFLLFHELVIKRPDPVRRVFIKPPEVDGGGRAQVLLGVEESEQNRLLSVSGDVLIRCQLSLAGREQAVEVPLLHRFADALVGADHAGGESRIFGCPLVQVGSDAQRSLHGDEESELQRRGAPVQIGDIGNPGRHDLGGVGVAEALLDSQAIEGFGIVGSPNDVDAFQNTQVHAPAAAGAGFNFQARVLRPAIGR